MNSRLLLKGLLLNSFLLPGMVQGQPVFLGSDFEVSSNNTRRQEHPAIATTANNGFVIVWQSDGQDGDNWGIQGRRFGSNGCEIGAEFQVNSSAMGPQTAPAVSSDSTGRFVVAWQTNNGGDLNILGQRYTSSGNSDGSSFSIPELNYDEEAPSIAHLTNGYFAVGWDEGLGNVQMQVFSDGDTDDASMQVNSHTTGSQGKVAIASDDNDNLVAVWHSEQDGSGHSVHGQRYEFSAAGGLDKVGSEFQINTYTTGSQQYPRIAVRGSGEFVVVWQSENQDGSDFSIQGQRYNSDGATMGGEFQVNTITTGRQDQPAVAFDDNGHFLIVWRSANEIHGQRYLSDGSPLGGEFQVTADSPYPKERPDVVSNDSFDFVVTWQDSNANEIRAQRLTLTSRPTFSKVFSKDNILEGETVRLTYTIDNSGGIQSYTLFDLNFMDTLPTNVVIAPSPNRQVSGCTGGTFSGNAGNSMISYSDGNLADWTVCTIAINVTGVAPGTYVSTSGNLISSVGDSGVAADTLVVWTPLPGFDMSFSPDVINEGGVSTLTFSIDNTRSTTSRSNVAFSHPLPAGVVVATLASTVNNCGGSLSAAAGSGTISLNGGSLIPSAICTVRVDVTSTALGMHGNTTGDLTSDAGNSGSASDTLTVNQILPGFAMEFSSDSIDAGTISTLTLTVNNSLSFNPVSSVQFTNEMPSEIVVAQTPNISNSCGGVVTAEEGGSTISLTGGSMNAGASCTVSVDVTSVVGGTHTNTTGDLGSSAGTSAAAQADLTVAAIADLSVALSDVPDLVPNDGEIRYTVTVDNAGPSVAENVLANVTLPAGVTFVETDGCQNDPGTTPPSCVLGSIETQAEFEVVMTAGVTSRDVCHNVAVSTATDDRMPDNNNSETACTQVDADAPTITGIRWDDGTLLDCLEARGDFRWIEVELNEEVVGAGEAASYLLVGAGNDADLATMSCSGGQDDDVPVEISRVVYQDRKAILDLNAFEPLANALYRLLVCQDEITDIAGNPLDENEILRTFRVERHNRFANGNFDCGLSSVSLSSDDIDGSSLSGSIQLDTFGEADFSQCVGVSPNAQYQLVGEARLVGAGLVWLTQAVEYFADESCLGASLSIPDSQNSFRINPNDTGWGGQIELATESPAGAQSALYMIVVDGDGVQAKFDRFRWNQPDVGLIFRDGFESGSTSAWSEGE